VCEIGPKLFQLYELGIKPNPGLLTLEKIARGFGMEVHELIGPSLPQKTLTELPHVKQRRTEKRRKKT